jgi:hypothetical protein
LTSPDSCRYWFTSPDSCRYWFTSPDSCRHWFTSPDSCRYWFTSPDSCHHWFTSPDSCHHWFTSPDSWYLYRFIFCKGFTIFDFACISDLPLPISCLEVYHQIRRQVLFHFLTFWWICRTFPLCD